MAEIEATKYQRVHDKIDVWRWAGLTESDTCAPIPLGDYSDVTVQVGGTFGSGTLSVQGSAAPQDAGYVAVHDPQGNALSFSAAGMEAVLEKLYWLKPVLAGATGANLDIYVLAR